MNNNKQCAHSALNGMTIQKNFRTQRCLTVTLCTHFLLHYLCTQFHKHFHQVEIVLPHAHTGIHNLKLWVTTCIHWDSQFEVVSYHVHPLGFTIWNWVTMCSHWDSQFEIQHYHVHPLGFTILNQYNHPQIKQDRLARHVACMGNNIISCSEDRSSCVPQKCWCLLPSYSVQYPKRLQSIFMGLKNQISTVCIFMCVFFYSYSIKHIH
jgi:hypothetical protein